jgi:hypothetical protein
MMGTAPMTPEEWAAQNAKLAEHKATVAASLGLTVEEFEARRRKAAGLPDVPRTASEAEAGGHAAESPSGEADATDEADDEVDAETVLRFINSRQRIIDEQRRRIRALESQLTHLEAQNRMAEAKNEALRTAVAKLRAQLAEQKRPE